jgi:hypothetical protein
MKFIDKFYLHRFGEYSTIFLPLAFLSAKIGRLNVTPSITPAEL